MMKYRATKEEIITQLVREKKALMERVSALEMIAPKRHGKPDGSESMKKHYEGSIAPLGTEDWTEPCDAFAANAELAARQVLEWNLKCGEIDEDQLVNVCVREITAAGDPINDVWEYLTGRAWVKYGSEVTSVPIANAEQWRPDGLNQPKTNDMPNHTDTPENPEPPSSRSPSTTCSRSSDTPETDVKVKRICGNWNNAGDRVQEFVLADVARELERGRDEARRMWSIHQDKLAGLREEVKLTIMENLHLADGDVCTLKRLKDAIGFDLDSSDNA
jgi:hypothetical protein